MTIGFGVVVIDLLAQLHYGRRVRRSPWGAGTLEWATSMPPRSYTFPSIPHVEIRADRVATLGLAQSLARGEGYLGFARNGWKETLGVQVTSGAPEQLIVLSGSSYLPLCTALATAAAALGFLFEYYLMALAMAIWTASLFVLAGRSAGLAQDYGPMPIGRGVHVPPHTEVAEPPPWLALVFALVADGTLFTSLVFGALYLWISAPNWPPQAAPEPGVLPAIVAASLAVAAAAGRGSLRAGGAGKSARVWIGLAMLSLLAAIAAVVIMISGLIPNPREHALGATAAALLAYVALHAGIGILFLLSNLLRLAAGRISRGRTLDLRLTRLWLDYTGATGLIALSLISALPMLVAMLGGRP